MKNSIIQDTENYLSEIKESEFILFIRFVGIIHEFMSNSLEKIYIQKKDYLKYVLIKGINCITYVFSFLLLYTSNLELSLYHTTKSFYYYIEFIGQVGDDSHAFLKLNSKDAYLFVLKKTIYEINVDFKKDFCEIDTVKNKLFLMDNLIDIYKKVLFVTIEKFNLTDDNYSILLKLITNNLYKLVELLMQLKSKNIEFQKEKIKEIDEFLDIFINMFYQSKNNNILLNYLENILKKIIKKKINFNNFKEKLMQEDSITKLEQLTMNKYISWLFEKK